MVAKPPAPKVIDMSTVKSTFGSLSLNNYYQVSFSGLTDQLNAHMQKYPKLSTSWITENVGLFCADASLPTSAFATAEVKENFMGTQQEFAHSRLFTDVDFTFYVDTDYNVLRFFEAWMDYISGGGEVSQNEGGTDPFKEGYYRRFQYPKYYKIPGMSITKFERSLGGPSASKKLVYQFVNVFPKAISNIPVSYGQADLLKVTVTFNYDRYVVDRSDVSATPSTPSSLTGSLSNPNSSIYKTSVLAAPDADVYGSQYSSATASEY